MPGKTGKRAKAPSPCARCGAPISGDFMREKDGDYHESCWWDLRKAGHAWDILVKHGGAVESMRSEFIHSIRRHDGRLPHEFRFQGTLGFGGKIRLLDGRFRVDYYPEDRTAERDLAVAMMNDLLAAL